MDYGVQFNKLMYERLLNGGDITLFSTMCRLYEASTQIPSLKNCMKQQKETLDCVRNFAVELLHRLYKKEKTQVEYI